MKHLITALAIVVCLSAPAAYAGQVSIGFEGPGEGRAPTDLSEDGYVVMATNMSISSLAKSGDGTDGPNEIERSAGTEGYLTITRPDAPFRFVSLDWQSENASPAVLVMGYLNGALVGADSFVTRPSAFTTFLANKLAGQTLDKLIIYPQRDGGGAGALDAVVLDDTHDALQISDVGHKDITGS